MIDLSSDNIAGCAPEIISEMSKISEMDLPAYGEDKITKEVSNRISQIFECNDLSVFPVITGSAANSIALASTTPSWGTIFCHEYSHINTDECGAPELMTGGAKLYPIPGKNNIMDLCKLEEAIKDVKLRGVHHTKPSTISITNLTEMGTIMTPNIIEEYSRIAKKYSLFLHMDGARFSNALAGSQFSPSKLSWESGVDVLTLGATKNGAMAAELIIFFNKEASLNADWLRKRGGHLLSKMRYISSQLISWLEQDRWIKWALHANKMAKRLEHGIKHFNNLTFISEVDGNEIFINLPDLVIKNLQESGLGFTPWSISEDGFQIIRLVCSFQTSNKEIDQVISLFSELLENN